MEDFMATILPRPADTGGIQGKLPPKSVLGLPDFVVLRKICFKHTIKTSIFPLKNVSSPKP